MRGFAGTSHEKRYDGIGVCRGVAIGRAFLVGDPRGHIARMFIPAEQIEAEIERLKSAIATAQQQVREIMKRVRAALGAECEYILESHLLMLEDRSLWRQVEELIRSSRASAEGAVRAVTTMLLDSYEQITNDYLREYGGEIADVSYRLINILSGSQTYDLDEMVEKGIIVADDLLPSVAADLDPRRVLGFVTNVGGWASRTSIIARSVNIPAVVGARDITGQVRSGETIIIDGATGQVILNPAPETLRFYTEQQSCWREKQVRDLEERKLPAITLDNHEIKLRANIELIEEIDALRRFNAAGVGLYRSEFLYSQAAFGLPTEDEQMEAYKLLAEMGGEDGAVIRTFDLDGDKLYLDGFKPERNPALGLRAIRLSLKVEHVFRRQVRAILRAGKHNGETSRLKILLPFVSNLDEVRQAKIIIADIKRELRAERLSHAEDMDVGVMIEAPASVVLADVLAPEADFFSLGINDLTQSLLAVDRGNENVYELFDPMHPAVLRAIKFVADAARQRNIPLNVCGEMASNPAQVIMLLGLGLRDLSMTPCAIPAVRRLVRSIRLDEARKVAHEALKLNTPAEVHRHVNSRLPELGSRFFAAAHFV